MSQFQPKSIVNFIKTLLGNFLLIGNLMLILSSCSSSPYLYDRPGFESGSVPPQEQGIEGQNRVAPDYYYRQQSPYPYQGQPQNYQPNQPYPYNQQYGQGGMQSQGYPPPQYGSPYQVYPSAGSRYYSNPYAIPASPYYPQYDADQYYVPPAYYGVENQQNSMQKPQASGKSY
ncbi:MAG: hypothetical protein ACKO47_00225 [Alphaproteobacteria bacterium]